MKRYRLVCAKCHNRYENDVYQCPQCGGTLHTDYQWVESESEKAREILQKASCYWDYQPFFSVGDDSAKVSLGEGNTPLVRAKSLENQLGMRQVYVKNEGLNPSGTFKDRCMSIALSKALEAGARAVTIGSAGNAGAAAAAYSARAGLACYVLVPADTPIQRITQIRHYGAQVIPVRGSVTDCIELIGAVYQEYGWQNVTTAACYNPFQADAEKAIAYEIARQMDWNTPDWIVTPVGGGGILSGIYRGYRDLVRLGLVDKMPKMVGVQEAGCNPLVRAFRRRLFPSQIERILKPEGVAVAIADAFPLDGETALSAIYESGGWAEDVTDQEILAAQALIGTCTGIFAETASAAAIAGLKKMRQNGVAAPGESAVCVVTGNGTKELAQLAAHSEALIPIDASKEALKHRIEEKL